VRASNGPLPHQVVALDRGGNSARPSLGASDWPPSGQAAVSYLHPFDCLPTSLGVCHVRATRQGIQGASPVTHGDSPPLTRTIVRPGQRQARRPNFQAGHAGSTTVARSYGSGAGQPGKSLLLSLCL
jgi:hypothetical protein